MVVIYITLKQGWQEFLKSDGRKTARLTLMSSYLTAGFHLSRMNTQIDFTNSNRHVRH